MANLTSAQNNHPNSSEYMERAIAKFKDGKIDEANVDFQSAIKLEPENPKIYYSIAAFKYDQFSHQGPETGYCKRSIAELLTSALEKAVKFDENELIKEIKDFLTGYIYYEFAAEQWESPNAYSLDELEENFDYNDLCQRDEYEKIVQKNVRDIIFDLKRLIEVCPDWDFPYFEMGWYQIEVMKDYHGAIESFTRVIELVNSNKAKCANSAYYNRGEAKFNLGDLEGARADYDIAISLNPNEGEYYYKH
jgi:tetratricopeptide (TPR) repeat protein